MSAVHLTRSLVLEGPVKTADGAGGHTIVWTPLGLLWAEVRPGTGREVAAAGATLSRVPYRITVRAAPFGAPSRPDPGQRFRDGDRIFAITAVAPHRSAARYLTCQVLVEVAP